MIMIYFVCAYVGMTMFKASEMLFVSEDSAVHIQLG